MKEFLQKNKKQVLIGIIIIIGLFLLKRNWHKIAAFLNPAARRNNPDSVAGEVPQDRKNLLEDLAGKIYNDIQSTSIWGHNAGLYSSALSYYDDELVYMAKFYKNQLSSGNSLYSDMSDQWYVNDSYDYSGQLYTKLSELGQN